MSDQKRIPGSGWILADFDDTLAPGDSHAGLLRHILRRRGWPLLLWPVMALGGVLYMLPRLRRQGQKRGTYGQQDFLGNFHGRQCEVNELAPP